MKRHKRLVVFQDHRGQFPPGRVFYPESLLHITPILEELRSEKMGQPKYFNTNVQFFLNEIIKYFEGIHDNHNAAKTVYDQYRTGGHQYCLYLRNFWLSGLTLNVNIERNYTLYGLSGHDRSYRQLVKNGLKAQINSLSFVNIRDYYYPSETGGSEHKRDFTIPSFRVLSHNWHGIVSEAIKGAKLIVLNIQSETGGVQFEVNVIRECGMAQRTICIAGKKDKYADALSDFYDVIEVQSSGPVPQNTPEIQRLKDAIEYLTNDNFMQKNLVRDLSDIKCYVIEKNIDLATSQYKPEILSDVAYEDYIPSSLVSNWNLFSRHYPEMVQHWEGIDKMIRIGQRPDISQVADVMYEALGTFYLAVTLERYEEMAFSVGIVGIAHQIITGQDPIMTDCCGHAAKCAAWGDNMLLAKAFGDLPEELRK